MSLINTVLQASSVLMNSQNSQWQREREYERGQTALEVEKIRQEHQLKMTYLQQELQQNAREQDRIRQAEQRGSELINQAHLDGAKIRDSERYLRGTWKEAHFGSEQPPYVIFCINPLQDLNPLKEEAFRIAPFQRTYDNFKTRNAAYVGRLFSTITISETFKSEAEARSFFYRELNCPCIIVYGIFTGTGFGIYALTAGMSPDQLRIDGKKVTDWGVRIEKLWDISYNTIHAIKQKALDDAIKQIKKKAAETDTALPTNPELLRQKAVELRGRFDVLEGLELYTDTHVGLCVQVMLDNYFSYFPRQVYEVKTPAFLEAKQRELTRLGIWEALKTSLLERYEVLKGRQELDLKISTDDVVCIDKLLLKAQEFRNDLENVLRNIKMNSAIEIVKSDFKYSTIKNPDFPYANLPTDIQSFYLAFDDVCVRWEQKNKENKGSIVFYPIFASKLGYLDYCVVHGVRKKIFYKDKFIVLGEINDQSRFGFFIDNPNNMVIYNTWDSYESLQINFNTFFKLFCYCLGVHYWPRMITQIIHKDIDKLFRFEQQKQLFITSLEPLIKGFSVDIFQKLVIEKRDDKMPILYRHDFNDDKPDEILIKPVYAIDLIKTKS